MPPVSASIGLPVPSKIVMKGNSIMTLHERFSDIAPPKIEQQQQPKIQEPTVTARLDIGLVRGDFKREKTPRRRGGDHFFDGDGDSPPRFDRRNVNGNVYSMKNRREMTKSPMSNNNRSLSRRLGSRNSIYEALRDQRTNLKQRLGAKGRLGGGFGVNDDDGDGWRGRRTPTAAVTTKVSPFDDLDTIFRNNRTRSRFTYRGFQKRRFGYRRNGFSSFGTQRFRNRHFGNNSIFRFGGGKFQAQQTRNDHQNNKQQQLVSKEELDDEIDAYMAKTKLNLDNDLDVYMADV